MQTKRRRFFDSLAFKIGVIIILTEMVVLSLTGSLYIHNFNTEIDQRIEKNLLLPATLLNKGILKLNAVTDNEQMRQLVGEDLTDAFVIGINDNIFFSLNSAYTGQLVKQVPSIDPNLLARGVSGATVIREQNGQDVSVSPLFAADGQSVRFYLYITADNSAAQTQKAGNAELFVIGSLATILATSVVILIAFNVTVFHPLRKVLAVFSRVEVGDLTARVSPADTRDELGMVQRDLNRMIGRLQQSFETLEQRVVERTEELQVAKDAAEEARRLAEAANQAKSAFLANMSHELRTPLNAILGYADILKRRAGYTGPLSDGLDIIQRSGEHLLTLINDVLDLAKIEAGKLELYPAPCHLPTFLRQIVGIIRARAEAKDLSLTYEALSPLPDVVLADETRLRQVLLNLLGNAVKFTDRGHVTLRVSKLQITNGELPANEFAICHLRFEVEDTGPGIPPDQLARIFQPFEQVSEAERRAEGAGLGLAISQQMVQLMGSRLQVKSEPGHGSVFWFEVALPVIESAVAEQPAVRQITGYEGARRRVLVVDDKAYNRLLLADMLVPLGFEVSTAEDGQQAVTAAQAWRPDVILMDLVMPVKTGFEAVREIRQQPAFEDVFIVAVSASVLEADEEKSRLAGCDAFLPKPVKMDKLLDLLEARLELSWICAAPKEQGKTVAAPLIAPPQEELAVLYQLARSGRILGIRKHALHLAEMDAAYLPFVDRLQELARGFELDQIVALVEQFIEEEGNEKNE
jgi:signal transduction histidine kinase/DNA-binding NarL/FixJ family response regulator